MSVPSRFEYVIRDTEEAFQEPDGDHTPDEAAGTAVVVILDPAANGTPISNREHIGKFELTRHLQIDRPRPSERSREDRSRGFEEESKCMTEKLLYPPLDMTEIARRQATLRQLVGRPDLDRLLLDKEEAYAVIDGTRDLTCFYEDFAGRESTIFGTFIEGIPTLNIYEDYNDTPVGVIEVEAAVRRATEEVRHGFEMAIGLLEKLSHLGEKTLSSQFAAQKNQLEDMRSRFDELLALDGSGRHKEPSTSQVFYSRDSDPEGEMLNLLWKEIQPTLVGVGSYLEYARLIRDEGWAEVSFDEHKPAGYTGAWNPTLPKHRAAAVDRLEQMFAKLKWPPEPAAYGGISQESDTDSATPVLSQIPIDSPADTPITVYSGPNTSGKSASLNTSLMVQLTGQALGFAPVESANIHTHDSIVYLERGGTDAVNDLSAFMREALTVGVVARNLGQSPLLLGDELFSTTSPEGQAALQAALCRYVAEQGGKIKAAGHNDLLFDHIEQLPPTLATIAHLAVTLESDGTFTRHFRVEQGRSDSQSLDVARSRGFPEDILAATEAYMAGQLITPQEIKPEYARLQPWSDEERAGLMLLEDSLDHLFPIDSDSAMCMLLSQDTQFANMFRELRTQRITDEGETSLSSQLNGALHMSPDVLKSTLQKMVRMVGPQSAEELLERQQMLDALLSDGTFATLHEAMARARNLSQSVSTVVAAQQAHLIAYMAPSDDPDFDNHGAKGKDLKSAMRMQHELDLTAAYLAIIEKVYPVEFQGAQDVKLQVDMLSDLLRNVPETKPHDPIAHDDTSRFNAVLLNKLMNDTEAVIGEKEAFTLEELRGAHKSLRRQLREAIETLPTLEMKDVPQQVLDTEVAQYQKLGDAELTVSAAIGDMRQEFAAAEHVVTLLRATDSVYLRQAANYLERQIAKHRAEIDGTTTQSSLDSGSLIAAKAQIESRRSGQPKGSGSDIFHTFLRIKEPSPYEKTLHRLDALCLLADVIDTEGFAKVHFTETGEVRLDDAFSVFKPKAAQVHNALHLSSANRVNLHTGPNGSGKTYDLKKNTVALLFAHATGYAPAAHATMPKLDKIIYLDRVTTKEDPQLSSFAQELTHWQKILQAAGTSQTAFIAADEAFSTTSGRYQAAFTYGVLQALLGTQHFVQMSVHNHELVEKLGGMVTPDHFGFEIRDGEIAYHYDLRPGHEQSHALEVARKMRLPQALLDIALDIKK